MSTWRHDNPPHQHPVLALYQRRPNQRPTISNYCDELERYGDAMQQQAKEGLQKVKMQTAVPTKTPKVISAVTRADADGDSSLSTGETAVLKAVFQYGERSAPFPAIALMTGYASRSITNYVGRLAAVGLVERVLGGLLITDAGKTKVPAGTKPYPRGKALIEHLIRTLPEGESRVLAEVLEAHPNAAQIQELQVATKYAPRSITNYAGRLTARRAIVRVGRGALKIHPEVLK
jgi:Mn-dependent DtxR family transcriptional regulator